MIRIEKQPVPGKGLKTGVLRVATVLTSLYKIVFAGDGVQGEEKVVDKLEHREVVGVKMNRFEVDWIMLANRMNSRGFREQ